VITGTGTFIDGDVKLFDRHTQKVIAETQLRAKGSPCDTQQTVTQGASNANGSFTSYLRADVDAWLAHEVAALKH
jgi:hypothetical protein